MTMIDSLRQRWQSSVDCLVSELHSQLSYQESDGSKSQQAPPPPPPPSDDETANAIILSSLSSQWIDKVESLYNEPHRAYHNMTHIGDVLSSLDILLGTTQPKGSADAAILALAAFFHDVIYDPKSSTNEKDSADLFVEFASELANVVSCASRKNRKNENNDETQQQQQQSSSEISASKSPMTCQIERCILATAAHVSSASEANKNNDKLVAAFLDADMSVLGRDAERYDGYAGCIRKEYEFVPRDVYCEKRAEILESFLPGMMEDDDAVEQEPSSDHRKNEITVETSVSESTKGTGKEHLFIYATEKGRDLWEDKARRNLRREIGMLVEGTIPCENEL